MTMTIRDHSVNVAGRPVPIREAGPAGGVPVVLLHGFPDCHHSFAAQLEALAAAGHRAIAPALRGYTPATIASDGDYYLTTLVADLIALLDALALPVVDLVGHDWGGVIGWLAIAQHPTRFRSFASLAIPPVGGIPRAVLRHPGQLRNSWYMFFFQLRGLADHVVARNDFAFIERLWRDWSPGWSWPAETMAAVKATFRQPGVPRAALGYYRCAFDLRAAANRDARALGRRRLEIPVQILMGRRDGCMDVRLAEAALDRRQFDAGVHLELIDGAGHFLHLERPAHVSRLLTDFIQSSGR